MLLLSQGLLFIIIIINLPLLKKLLVQLQSVSVVSAITTTLNDQGLAAETEMKSGTWDMGLKQTNTCALKLSTALLLLFLELKICMGIFSDEKQSKNCMKDIHTIQLTKVPSAGTCTRQLIFGVENTLLFYHI